MGLENLLQTAVHLEEEGYRHYSENADKASNPLSRRLLETLAEQEIQHKSIIQKLGESIDLSTTTTGDLDNDRVEEAVREVFKESEESERRKWHVEDLSIYQKAREMEEKSIEIYKQMLNEVQDQKQKEFLQNLIEEERKHLESIDNIQYYLTNTEDWLSIDESRRWNWMV